MSSRLRPYEYECLTRPRVPLVFCCVFPHLVLFSSRSESPSKHRQAAHAEPTHPFSFLSPLVPSLPFGIADTHWTTTSNHSSNSQTARTSHPPVLPNGCPSQAGIFPSDAGLLPQRPQPQPLQFLSITLGDSPHCTSAHCLRRFDCSTGLSWERRLARLPLDDRAKLLPYLGYEDLPPPFQNQPTSVPPPLPSP